LKLNTVTEPLTKNVDRDKFYPFLEFQEDASVVSTNFGDRLSNIDLVTTPHMNSTLVEEGRQE
jgi:hypothetical protein